MMSPSSALANRSFLYGGNTGGNSAVGGNNNTETSNNRQSSACLISDKIVYATLDSLALRRATLPLRLLPEPIDPTHDQHAVNDTTSKPNSIVAPESSSANTTADSETYEDPALSAPKSTPQMIEIITSVPTNTTENTQNGNNSLDSHNSQPFDSESDNNNYNSASSSINDFVFLNISDSRQDSKKQNKKSKPGKNKDNSESKKEKREFTFAKNVLHYVPMTSRRYYRKSRKLASKSLSLKNLADKASHNRYDDSILNTRTLKSRSLSRDELKYITISMPSNFVHVASATRSSLMTESTGSVSESDQTEKSQRPHITHKEKCVDLRGEEYAMVTVAKDQSAAGNESFLWKTLPIIKDRELETKCIENTDEDYDDVGPPVTQYTTIEQTESSREENKNCSNSISSYEYEQDTYDDVGPATISCPKVEVNRNDVDDQVYDDVGPLRPEMETTKVELRESSVDDEPDEDVYDDVGLPLRHQNHQDQCHERVNSLYASSSVCESMNLPGNTVADKESEWEDLDDSAFYATDSGTKQGNDLNHTSPSKKKLGQQRWSRKVRRQRSKASRKSSGRSTSRTRPRNGELNHNNTQRDNPTYSVAVSLGTGSVLLLGPIEDELIAVETQELRINDDETKGLVQLRIVLVNEEDDVQETSLYVAEDSSDDSNYETLQIYEPDDFSSDSDTETKAATTTCTAVSIEQSPLEAPSRPIPPPPREASLGYSLGRRMKMLRRTWSITKGSLGRMRRRASGECEPTTETTTTTTTTTTNGPSGSSAGNDARKYFSFKKHFRKSQATALSTFYLDKGSSGSVDGKDGDNCKEEPIYCNSNCYLEAGLYRDEESNKSEESPPVDHYSVLAEEPLYQFYTIAATRVAFESDSDGYEEVEELTPTTATTDLAKPGHRTLWCQTPQVINSGLLQSLSMEERKIQEAKFEILTSEASYLNSLRVLENEFASNYDLVQEILTPAERDKLFGSVPDVLVASERFLAELETVWREDPMLIRLPEVLLKHGERSSDVYVSYCSNQVSIDTALKELRAKKGYKFLETVSRIEMHPACQSLSLHSFLMLPMQRITRLPLLADAVLSKLSVEHSERLSWERVLAALSHIVGKCNEGARLAERRNEMDALARKLEYSAKVPPIALRDRELIRSGTVIQLSNKHDNEYKLTFGKKFHKTPLMLMLLTDYLLVTKLKSNSNEETYTVIDTCKRSLVALESAPEDSAFAGRHAMVLTLLENHLARQVEYVLTCENDTEKERWLDAVSPPKPTQVGETLYESWDCPQVMALYSYAPRQPDELALQPGDVINVLRKMNDGWLFGEKLLDGEQGWFPGNFTKEVASEHVRARNLRQRHRFLALSGSMLQRKAKQSLSLL